MKWLLCVALCGCAALAHAAPMVSCDELRKQTGLQTGQQFSTVQWTQLQEAAIANPQMKAIVLGGVYLCGIGVPKNVETGLNIWKAAALEGQPAAFFLVVGFYVGAFGEVPDQEKTIEWLTLGAQAGIPELQLALGEQYIEGGTLPKDMLQAERWFMNSAVQGNAEAQEKLGGIYLEAKKYSQARQWLNLSALQGRRHAQLLMGQLYFSGQGVGKDSVTAVKWWRMAAERKYATAQFNLGYAYDTGSGVEKNQEEAIKWFRLAAEQSFPQALEVMARLYEFGLGVQQDKALAFQWWNKLAAMKNLPAQIRLGWMYMRGVGVAKNTAEGIKWFRTAVEHDMPEAHVSLALAYEYGLGVPVDLDIAHDLRLKQRNRPYAGELIDSCAFIEDGQLNEQDAQDFRLKLRAWTPEAFTRQAEKYLAAHKPQDALCWYQRAADSVFVDGLAPLGNAYLANGEILANPKLGIHYLRVGATRGDVPSRVRLAQAFQAGDVLPKSMVAAYALRFSTKRDLAELDSVLEGYHSSVDDEMTLDQIVRAKQLIRDMYVPGQYLKALDRATIQ